MNTLGERIRHARKALDLTQGEVADFFNIKRVNVTQWEGDTTRPDQAKLAKLPELLGGSIEWYLTGTGKSPDDTPNTKQETFDNYLRVPLVSWVSAGRMGESQSVEIDDIDELPSIHAPDLDPSGDWIALRVDGRSMDKISPHDSIIFVNRKDKNLVDRGIYVFADGEGGATFKQFRYPNRLCVMTTKTDDYKDIVIEDGNMPEVVGRVKKTILDL